jgi:hypothetical protein
VANFNTGITSYSPENYSDENFQKFGNRWFERNVDGRRKSLTMNSSKFIQKLKKMDVNGKPALDIITPSMTKMYKHMEWVNMEKSNITSLEYSNTSTREVHRPHVPKGTVMTLQELLDEQGVDAFLKMTKEEFGSVVTTDKSFDEMQRIVRYRKVDTHYHYSASKEYGRLYAPGIQNLCKPVRGLVAHHTTDIDMENAHPRILHWLCKRNGIEAPELEYFINNREKVYATINADRNVAKDELLTIMNSHDGDETTPFHREMHRTREKLDALAEYKYIKGDTSKGNRVASKMNLGGDMVILVQNAHACL